MVTCLCLAEPTVEFLPSPSQDKEGERSCPSKSSLLNNALNGGRVRCGPPQSMGGDQTCLRLQSGTKGAGQTLRFPQAILGLGREGRQNQCSPNLPPFSPPQTDSSSYLPQDSEGSTTHHESPGLPQASRFFLINISQMYPLLSTLSYCARWGCIVS